MRTTKPEPASRASFLVLHMNSAPQQVVNTTISTASDRGVKGEFALLMTLAKIRGGALLVTLARREWRHANDRIPKQI